MQYLVHVVWVIFLNLTLVSGISFSQSHESPSRASDRCVRALDVVLQNKILEVFDPNYLDKLAGMSEMQLRSVYPTFNANDIINLKQLLDTPRLIELRKARAYDQIKMLKEEQQKLIPALKQAMELRRKQTKADLIVVDRLRDYGLIGEKNIAPHKLRTTIEKKVEMFDPSEAMKRLLGATDDESVVEPIFTHLALSPFRHWIREGNGDFMHVFTGLSMRQKSATFELARILRLNHFDRRMRAFQQASDKDGIVDVAANLLDEYFHIRYRSLISSEKLMELMEEQAIQVSKEWTESQLVITSPSNILRRVYPYISYLRNQIVFSEYDEMRYFAKLIQFDLLADPTDEMVRQMKDLVIVKNIALKSSDPDYAASILTMRGDTTGRVLGPVYHLMAAPIQSSRDIFWGVAAILGWYQRPLD